MMIQSQIVASAPKKTGLSLMAILAFLWMSAGCGQPTDSQKTMGEKTSKTNIMNSETSRLSSQDRENDSLSSRGISSPENEAHRKVRNNIQFKEHGGLYLEQAFLLTQDDHLVGEDNLVGSGERFKLILYIKNWKDDNGTVALGASEVLVTSEEDIIVKEPDLFAGHDPISLKDAGVITLSMQVTKAKTLFDFYQVHFRVFGKSHDQWIEGAYRFNLK